MTILCPDCGSAFQPDQPVDWYCPACEEAKQQEFLITLDRLHAEQYDTLWADDTEIAPRWYV